MAQHSMVYTIFDQQNYSGELGTGHGVTIHDSGCALCSVAMLLVNCFGISTDPNALNTALNNVGGFAPDANGNYDEIKWGAINQIYSQISLNFDVLYPSTPADMSKIDPLLQAGNGVVVGVSFAHNVQATVPDHYVLLIAKNSDGTYQVLDPWYGDSVVYDTRYAVNGMSVAQSILQAVSYNGPISKGGGNMFKLPSGNEVDLSNTASMQVCATIWDAVVNLKQYWPLASVNSICTTLGIATGSTVDAINAAIVSLQNNLNTANTNNSTANKQVTTLEGQNQTLTNENQSLTTQLATANQANTDPKSGLTWQSLYIQAEQNYQTTLGQLQTAQKNNSQLQKATMPAKPQGFLAKLQFLFS